MGQGNHAVRKDEWTAFAAFAGDYSGAEQNTAGPELSAAGAGRSPQLAVRRAAAISG
jgi:hypothetical protein